MSAVLKSLILVSFFSLSISAGKVTFDNKSRRDTTFFLEFKKIAGSKAIVVAAEKSTEESLDEFLKDTPSATALWIYARQRKSAPYGDVYCSPTLTVAELENSEANWKITFTEKSCEITRY